jgi:uncharacterized lipoprotein YddW (UPF0748 family)
VYSEADQLFRLNGRLTENTLSTLMMHRSRRRLAGLLALILAAACRSVGPVEAPGTPNDTMPPPVVREMRGLWVATVANIDWPSSATLSMAQQQAELAAIIDQAAEVGINAIILQVRPAGDALYQSSIEPWGAMLTGTQGTSPGYDPLAFAVERAHARGLELHAWINPFRAGNTSDTTRLAANHIFRTRRDLVRVYGTHIWMDPGEPDVHDHSIRVATDIARRYDVDAIHADDYFYPYVVNDAAGRPVPFPDAATYARYGGGTALDDWRRANVDRFVARLAREVHAVRPTLKVGISPFGIWRPNNPPGIQGMDAFASIYADARKWLMEGTVDYLAPQLYWSIASAQQSFPLLLDWWLAQNPTGRHVWPGLASYRVLNGTASAFSLAEVPQQVRLTRGRAAGTGHILYNTTWTLKRNGGAVADSLRNLYRLDGSAPATPAVAIRGDTLELSTPASEGVRWYVVRTRSTSGWSTRVLFHTQSRFPLAREVSRILVQGIDAAGNTSAVVERTR